MADHGCLLWQLRSRAPPLTQYRFKKNSKMRNRELNNPEVPRLLRTLFADLYPVRKLLLDHHELLKPNGFSESVRMDVSV